MNLYELSEEYRIAEQLFNDADNDEYDEALTYLYEVEDQLVSKVENIIKLIKNIEADHRAFKAEEAYFKAKKQSAERKIKSLKEYLNGAMESTNTDKINGELFTIWMQKNPHSLEIKDDASIPEEYYEPQPPKLLSRELLTDIKDNGVYIDGVELKQTRSIRYK